MANHLAGNITSQENEGAEDEGQAPVFYGSPTFNGPVLFNSTWNANESTSPMSGQQLHSIDGEKFENELDANVEECSPAEFEFHKTTDDIYRIQAHPKGRILILNNEFKDSKRERKCNQMDVMNMMVLWQSVGFAVQIVSDLSSQRMQQEVRDFVQSERMKRVDICAIMVMSHGEKGDFILGEDNTKTAVQKFLDEVNNSNILRGKPKLLFFQMSRNPKTEKYAPMSPSNASQVQSDSPATTQVNEETDRKWCRDLLSTLLLTSHQGKQRHVSRQLVRFESMISMAIVATEPKLSEARLKVTRWRLIVRGKRRTFLSHLPPSRMTFLFGQETAVRSLKQSLTNSKNMQKKKIS